MISPKLDADGDLIINEQGELVMIDGDDELLQSLRIGLNTNRGEWFLNPDLGIDFSLYVGKNPNEEEMRSDLSDGILQESRVDSVDEITFERDLSSRQQTISFKATKKTGEVITMEGVDIGAG